MSLNSSKLRYVFLHCHFVTGFRLHDFVVLVSNTAPPYIAPLLSPTHITCAQYNGAVQNGAIITMTCNQPVYGRYVSLHIPSVNGMSEIITVCEVEVFGI